MTFFVAGIAQRKAVGYFKTQFWVKDIRLDVMSTKENVNGVTILARIGVAFKNSLAPFSDCSTVAVAACMLSAIWSWRVKLSGYHCSAAFVRTKDMAVSAFIHLFNFGRIAFKFIAAKGASEDGLFNSHSSMSAFVRTIVVIAQLNFEALKFFSASITEKDCIFCQRSTFAGTVGNTTFVPLEQRGAFVEFLSACRAS